MTHPSDPGYGSEPFRTLCADYPDETVYSRKDFRVEWGPIFHRGRLDGSARVLVLGQDPAAQEAIARRILVGMAGHRTQGFLAKAGIDRSYVMINTFLYGVYGQSGGEKHAHDAAIADYRHRWLDALLKGGKVEVVVALGHLAETAWQRYRKTPAGAGVSAAFVHVTHPTQPDSAARGDKVKLKQLTAAMLKQWNKALLTIRAALAHPDRAIPFSPYGEDFTPAELVEIPEEDLPAGLPAWMRGRDAWAARTGATAAEKRRTMTVTVPATA